MNNPVGSQSFYRQSHHLFTVPLDSPQGQWGLPGGVTCEHLLGHLEGVDDGRGDARHGPDHTAQAQVDEHQEEHDGPERGGGEVRHGLGEGDEGQACALHGLRVGAEGGAE